MATIKSYTDLEQSKKLAEILPIESADMLWGYYYNGKNHCIPNIRPFRDGRNEIPKGYIPAWSLAALLKVIRETIGYTLYGVNYTLNVYMSCSLGDRPWKLETNVHDNEVDVCYEMIMKLHEHNLL